MVFSISRTSQYNFDKNKPPCKNATIKQKLEDRTTYVDDENGVRIREHTEVAVNYWAIEINTLDELMNLIREVKEEIIVSDGDIEIYDSCRE